MKQIEKILWTTAIAVITLAINGNADILVYYRGTNTPIEEFHDLPARFGAPFPVNGMRTLAYQSNPSDACSSIAPPPNSNNTHYHWAVIITRGNCSFEIKVRNAQKAGYSAAIVHNVNSDDLEQMSANNEDDISIPSMFVGEATGRIIIYNYLYENNITLILNGDLPFNINTHLILPFTIVVGLCFIIMIGFMIVKCVREHQRLRRHRLPGSVLRKIPIIRFNKEQHVAMYETCAICLDDYVDGDKLRVLPCAHAYHSKCIDPWLTKNRRVCPTCKRKVFARGEARRRRRHSSDDSMSDSDYDDTTPLLNPVDNANNHGTFNAASSIAEGLNYFSDQSGSNSQNRFNPFDRQQISVSIAPENGNYDTSYWRKFVSIFRAPDEGDDQSNEASVVDAQASRDDVISQNRATNPILGTFKKCAPRNSTIAGAESDSDDDDELAGSSSIYAPVRSSWKNLYQAGSSTDAVPSTSQPRIAIAAIPNQNFHQPSISQRNSSSSPSIYVNSGSRASNERHDENEIGNFKRSPASSSDYFV